MLNLPAAAFIVGVYLDTWRTLSAHWRVLLQAVAIPVLTQCLVVVWLSRGETGVTGWPAVILLIFYGLANLLAIIVCHRVTLLGPNALGNRWGLWLSSRHLVYALWIALAAVGVLLAAAAWFLFLFFLRSQLGMSSVVGATDPDPIWLSAISGAYAIACLYFFTRLSLVLPAAAIGDRVGPDAAWGISERRGWQLLLATTLPALSVAVTLGPLLVLVESQPSLWFQLPALVLANLGALVSVIALSCAYRRLLYLEGERHNDTPESSDG